MSNLRLLHDNAADRATVVASSTAGTLVAANLLNDYKGLVHRSSGTSVSYTLTWGSAQSLGAVVLPATNLSAGATIRVQAGGYDSGTVPACPGLDLSWWQGTVNANSFAYGALSKVAVWFPAHVSASSCTITLADPGNAAGYIDCARLVVGPWWSPTYNASYGAQAGISDTSTPARTDAGDLLAERGTSHDTLSLSLDYLPESDRAALLRILRGAGAWRNVALSLLPDAASGAAQRDHLVFGKLRNDAALAAALPGAWTGRIELEGW